MIADTATSVSQNSTPQANAKIRQDMEQRLAAFRSDDKNELISKRLQELDREWDVERTLQTNFATLSLVGLSLATQLNKKWFALALGVPAFMVQHALQGWCPPLPVLRKLGVRSAREISDERFALKAMRGDFDEAAQSRNADALIKAVRS
ncbi:hypothetical protein Q8A64_18340 [Oxalobacteraceae bacterium R-40]|uniref:DUF2892 domain-containing protein n=1 Tax=Keguizhuia sedimenti TaxID=3064264 RepID=A0ABU1BTL8_9BURK|nr:hypothetical protein [Oxalobacteraceae bacterium R-40]